MMKTKNLRLVQPGENDYCDVQVLNDNFDKLDTVLGPYAENLNFVIPVATTMKTTLTENSIVTDTQEVTGTQDVEVSYSPELLERFISGDPLLGAI